MSDFRRYSELARKARLSGIKLHAIGRKGDAAKAFRQHLRYANMAKLAKLGRVS